MEKKLILFGAGQYGKEALSYYGAKHVFCFVDNNSARNGSKFFNKRVINAKTLISLYQKDAFDIVISSEHREEIANQLNEMGIKEYTLFSPQIIKQIERFERQVLGGGG